MDVVNNAYDHPTAEQIYLKLKMQNKPLVLATVYNNLNALCAEGLIRRISIEGQADHFDRIQKHDHLYCKKCGKLADVTLDDLTDSFEKQIGSAILSYDLKICYLCSDCRSLNNSNSQLKKRH